MTKWSKELGLPKDQIRPKEKRLKRELQTFAQNARNDQNKLLILANY